MINRSVPSQGIAFDAWAGLVAPEINDAGMSAIPEHPSIGMHAGPLFGALGVVAAILRAPRRRRAASSRSVRAVRSRRRRLLPASEPAPVSRRATRPTDEGTDVGTAYG